MRRLFDCENMPGPLIAPINPRRSENPDPSAGESEKISRAPINPMLTHNEHKPLVF
jgi:hypothetical protein